MTLAGSENVVPAPPSAAAALLARVKAILTDRSDSRLAQLVAGKVFLVRVASAVLALGQPGAAGALDGLSSNSASTSMCGPGC